MRVAYALWYFGSVLFNSVSWAEIDRLRERCGQCSQRSLEAAAQDFAGVFAESFESLVLARVFAVLPLKVLPTREHAFALQFAEAGASLSPDTPVLTLLGTRGREAAWNSRDASQGHLAIPLLDQRFVQGIPMISKLLADLDVDLRGLDLGQPIITRQMLGGRNGTFYVADAQTACDDQSRFIIPARDFVAAQKVRTVFGMGGAYIDGTLIVCILFTREELDRATVDHYPSLISNFKMVTSKVQVAGAIFDASA